MTRPVQGRAHVWGMLAGSAMLLVVTASLLLETQADRVLALFPLDAVVAVIAGVVIGRWRAMALALVVPVALAFSPNLEDGRDDETALAYAVQAPLLAVVFAVLVAVGVTARKTSVR